MRRAAPYLALIVAVLAAGFAFEPIGTGSAAPRTSAGARELVRRVATPKPVRTAAFAGLSRRNLHVKFVEGSQVRLRAARFATLGSDDLSALDQVMARVPGAHIERMTPQSEAEVALEGAALEAQSGRELADFNLWYRVRLPAGRSAAQAADDLNGLSIVEIAYPAPLPGPLPVSPDYRANQDYLDAPPAGIGAATAHALSGGTGTLVQVFDIEYAWNTSHEDLSKLALPGALVPNGTPEDPFNDNNHGTAVMGELIADNDTIGVTGIAYNATPRMVNANTTAGYFPETAITLARMNANAGDVVLIEQQTVGANGGCGNSQVGCAPVEWVPVMYDAIALTTAANVHVVEAAGNGTQDLDGAEYAPWTNKPDSGAIIVGAGGSSTGATPRQRLSFSNYGDRVDVQAWGENVMTTGYGHTFGTSQSNDAYTAIFSGTSSASPIVAGAAAVYSSIYQVQNGNNAGMSTDALRSALVSTGTAQVGTGHIGPLPSLPGMLADATAPTAPTVALVDAVSGSSTYTGGQVEATVAGTDNIGVAAYFASESATPPALTAAGWKTSGVFTVNASAGDGVKTIYAFAKDGRGNISAAGSDTIVRDGTNPTARLSARPTTNERAVAVTVGGADGGSGIDGYLVTATATPPLAGDSRWQATPPTSFTLPGANGTKTLRGWTKDGAGNVSSPAVDSLLFDDKKPIVTVSQPGVGAALRSITQLKGKATDNLPPQYRKADFTLGERLGGGQCRFWSPVKHTFTSAPCSAPKRFLIKTASGLPNWTRNIGRLDDPGRYFVVVRFIDGAGNIGKREVTFRLVAGPGPGPAVH